MIFTPIQDTNLNDAVSRDTETQVQLSRARHAAATMLVEHFESRGGDDSITPDLVRQAIQITTKQFQPTQVRLRTDATQRSRNVDRPQPDADANASELSTDIETDTDAATDAETAPPTPNRHQRRAAASPRRDADPPSEPAHQRWKQRPKRPHRGHRR